MANESGKIKYPDEFYYGTSTKVPMFEYLKPASAYKRRVQITESYEQAVKYAVIASEKLGGEPIVYVVEVDPEDRFTLLKRTKTDWITSKAKIVSIKEDISC